MQTEAVRAKAVSASRAARLTISKAMIAFVGKAGIDGESEILTFWGSERLRAARVDTRREDIKCWQRRTNDRSSGAASKSAQEMRTGFSRERKILGLSHLFADVSPAMAPFLWD